MGEIVKAFVALKPGFEATDVPRKELLGHARKRLGAAVTPKEIEFRNALPRTRSGKIMRRLLRARELGLPEGGLSTLDRSQLQCVRLNDFDPTIGAFALGGPDRSPRRTSTVSRAVTDPANDQ